MRRSLEQTFERVQSWHASLAMDARYSKLPFTDRDKIIASILGCSERWVSAARRGVDYFSEFREDCNAYFTHDNHAPSHFFFEFVQCAAKYLHFRDDAEDIGPDVLDNIIADWCGYSDSEVRAARIASNIYAPLRYRADPSLNMRMHVPPEKAHRLVMRTYLKLLEDPAAVKKGVRELDELVARELSMGKRIVRGIRRGSHEFKPFGGIPPANKQRYASRGQNNICASTGH